MRLSASLEQIGTRTMGFLELVGGLMLLLTKVLRIVASRRIHWRNTAAQMAFIGVGSLPIALITSLSVGMVFTLQIANEFIRFGAASAVGGVSAIALLRELAPTLTGVVIAGRVGAAMAAELGSMKVTEQLDALTALAVDPIAYLVVPRVLACIVMLPLLAFLADVIGVLGGFGVAVAVKGLTSQLFLDSLQAMVVPGDVLRGLFKAGIFGALIGLIGCYQGMGTDSGARGVGKATTDAVVFALISIFIVNYFLSAWLFPGGRA